MNWIFVGAGNMASSLIGGLIASGANAEHVAVVDPDEAQRMRATDRFGIRQSASLGKMAAEMAGDQLGIVIAVKPHIVETVCKEVAGSLASTELQCRAGCPLEFPSFVACRIHPHYLGSEQRPYLPMMIANKLIGKLQKTC